MCIKYVVFMLISEKKLKNKDLYLVTSTGKAGWVSIVRSDSHHEACIESIKDLFSTKEKSLNLGMFIVSLNISNLIKILTIKLKKKKNKFSTIFRASEILADLSMHTISTLYKEEEDKFLKHEKSKQ